MPWIAAVAQGAGGVFGGVQSYQANQAQIEQSKAALDAQIAEADRQRANNKATAEQAQGIIANQGMQGEGALTAANQQAQDTLSTGLSNQLASLYGGQDAAAGALNDSSAQSIASIYGGANQGASAIQEGAQNASSALRGGQMGAEQATRQGNAAAASSIQGALDNSKLAGMYGTDLASDKGYQFRSQQGANAASMLPGSSGMDAKTAKALGSYNQNKALGEEKNFNARQTNMATQLDSSRMAAASSLAGLQADTGNSIASQRMTGGTQQSQNSSNAASGIANLYSGAGSSAASSQQSTGNDLASLYANTGAQAAGVIGNTGQQQASQYGNTGTQLANLYSQNATAQGNILTGQAAQNAQLSQALMSAYTVPTQYAGQGMASISNSIKNTGKDVASYFAQKNGYGQSGEQYSI